MTSLPLLLKPIQAVRIKEQTKPSALGKGSKSVPRARLVYVAKPVSNNLSHSEKEKIEQWDVPLIADQDDLSVTNLSVNSGMPRRKSSESGNERGRERSAGEKENIFEDELNKPLRQLLSGSGPTYLDGKLVRHTLVGPARNFERFQQRKQRLAEANSSLNPSDLFQRSRSYAVETLQVEGEASPKSPRRQRRQPTIRKLTQTNTTNSKSVYEGAMSKQELVAEIQKLRGRQRDFYTAIDRTAVKMPPKDRLLYTRQERYLQAYDTAQKEWDHTLKKVNSKVGRSKSESVVNKAEGFRERQEAIETLDMVQSEHERFGELAWYMNLRKDSTRPENRGAIAIHDMPNGFQSTRVDRPKSSLMIIRKPRSIREEPHMLDASSIRPTNESLNHTDRLTNRSFKDYYDQKSSILRPSIEKFKASADGIEDIEIKGDSKLEQEAQAALRQELTHPIRLHREEVTSKQGTLRYLETMYNDQKGYLDEIIEENYDKRFISRKDYGIMARTKLP